MPVFPRPVVDTTVLIQGFYCIKLFRTSVGAGIFPGLSRLPRYSYSSLIPFVFVRPDRFTLLTESTGLVLQEEVL